MVWEFLDRPQERSKSRYERASRWPWGNAPFPRAFLLPEIGVKAPDSRSPGRCRAPWPLAITASISASTVGTRRRSGTAVGSRHARRCMTGRERGESMIAYRFVLHATSLTCLLTSLAAPLHAQQA